MFPRFCQSKPPTTRSDPGTGIVFHGHKTIPAKVLARVDYAGSAQVGSAQVGSAQVGSVMLIQNSASCLVLYLHYHISMVARPCTGWWWLCPVTTNIRILKNSATFFERSENDHYCMYPINNVGRLGGGR